jgi:hypothetical protein
MAFGALKGTLSGTSGSITSPFAVTTGGPVTVAVGDLVIAVLTQQTALTVTGVTDNLGNTYTAQNVGTDAGAVTGRAFYSRVTVAGSLTTVTFAATASANDVAAAAAVIEGPFAAPPIDKNLANVTNDITSPFSATVTGTLTQADEVVAAWCSMQPGVTTWAASAPLTKHISVATGNVGVVISTATVAATTSVAPEHTNAVAPSSTVLGSMTFMKAAGGETITADKWHKPLTEPSRRAVTTALVAAGLVAPLTLGSGPLQFAAWYKNLSAPVQTAARTAVNASGLFGPVYTPVEEPAAEVSFAASETVVPYQRDLLYQSQFGPVPFDAPAEVVTLDKWHQPLSQPVRKVSVAPQGGIVFVGSDVARDTNWRRALSEPVRSNVRQVGQVYGPVYVEPPGETITIDKWHQSLSIPVRQQGRQQPDALTYVYPVPISGTDDIRFSGFETIVPYERALLYQSLFQPVAFDAPAPEVVTVDKWLKPLSEPTRRVNSSAQQARFAAFIGSDVARDTRWFQALSIPTRRPWRLDHPSFTYGYYVEPTGPPAEVFASAWLVPLAAPIRRGGLSTTQQQVLAYVAGAPFADAAPVNDEWIIRFRRRGRR